MANGWARCHRVSRRSVGGVAVGRPGAWSATDESLSAAFLNDAIVLVHESAVPGNHPASASRLRLERIDPGNHFEGVSEADGKEESPFQNRQKSDCIDPGCMAGQSGDDGQPEQPVSYGSPKWPFFRQYVVGVQWIEIAGKAHEQNDIGFGDGSGGALPLVTERQVVERECGPGVLCHAIEGHLKGLADL